MNVVGLQQGYRIGSGAFSAAKFTWDWNKFKLQHAKIWDSIVLHLQSMHTQELRKEMLLLGKHPPLIQ